MQDTGESSCFFPIDPSAVHEIPDDERAGHQQVGRERIRPLLDTHGSPGSTDVSDSPRPSSIEKDVTELVTNGETPAFFIAVVDMCEIDHDLRREPFPRQRDTAYRIGLELGLVDRDAESGANGAYIDEAAAGGLVQVFEKRGGEPLAVQMRYVEGSAVPALDQRRQLLSVLAGTSASQSIAQRLDICRPELGRTLPPNMATAGENSSIQGECAFLRSSNKSRRSIRPNAVLAGSSTAPGMYARSNTTLSSLSRSSTFLPRTTQWSRYTSGISGGRAVAHRRNSHSGSAKSGTGSRT